MDPVLSKTIFLIDKKGIWRIVLNEVLVGYVLIVSLFGILYFRWKKIEVMSKFHLFKFL